MSRLTKSRQDYLRAIFMLSDGNSGVRLTDIADCLGLSKASACVAISKLEENGFVVRAANRLITLTPDGEREAKRVIDNFTVIALFLTSKLHVNPHTAQTDAGALAHVMSEETVNALRLSLGQTV
jgi:DtxR family Mn-dependent transcriptional regulator